MSTESYFPTGIVTGDSFCNRNVERELLKKRLSQNAHVVLISPRRYGKSSLIAQFTVEQKIPSASVDLLPATSSKYVRNAIQDGVTQLLDNMMPSLKKAKEKLLSVFSSLNPVIELSAFGQRIKLSPQEKTPEESIMKMLLALDKAAGELHCQFIFVMDEFQQISILDEAHSLEASIRHAVERAKHVFYIFSGSNRTLLESMFQHPSRPLYHLCDEIKLNRISEEDYSEFIQNASKHRWKKTMPEMCIHEILALTECHPYYVNRLCRLLWDMKSIPSQGDITSIWNDYVESQKADWVSEAISKLSVNQRAILAALAKEPEPEPSGIKFSSKVGISTSSIQRTLQALRLKDLIYQDVEGCYRVLNPVVKTYLFHNLYFEF